MLNLKILSYIQFLIAGILLYFVYFAVKNQKNRLAAAFAAMTFFAAEFAIGYGFELSARSLNAGILAIKYEYCGLSFLPIFWFVFSYKFYYNRYPRPYIIISASIIPFIACFLVMTNELHYLYYKSYNIMPYGDYFLLNIQKNFFYYVFISYSYGIMIWAFFVFFTIWRKSKEDIKKQSRLMLLGTIWPPFTNILYLFGLTPDNYDPTTLGFLLMSYFFYRAIFEYEYLDIKEIVRYSVFDRINEGIIVIDKNYKIIDINTSATIIFSYLDSSSIGDVLTDYDVGEKIIANNENDYFEIAVPSGKKTRYFEFNKNDIINNRKHIGSIYIFQDITHQKELIHNLSYMATHDFLTDIYNRMNFLELGQMELYRIKRYGGEFSLLMIDIDFFKKVNDSYGHNAGDQVLKYLTSSIKNRLRTTDIFARYGGEEFVILLSKTNCSNSIKIAEDIRYKMEKSEIIINNNKIHITISIGVTHYDDKMPVLNLEQIIGYADTALYEAKNTGRNKVVIIKQDS